MNPRKCWIAGELCQKIERLQEELSNDGIKVSFVEASRTFAIATSLKETKKSLAEMISE